MRGLTGILIGKRLNNINISFNEITGASISSRRHFSRTPILVRFRNEPTAGSYTKGPDVKEVAERIYKDPKGSFKELYRIWRDEFKLFGKEMKSLYSHRLRNIEKGQVDMLFTFDHDKCLDDWILTTDSKIKRGFSTASFVRTSSDTALFSGYIDKRLPQDGETQLAGFASILKSRLLKSFKRFDNYDWRMYTHLVLKVRGDGRNYTIILGCPGFYDVHWHDQYHYPLYTRGGPYWQIVKIPFSNFYFTSGARVQDRQGTMGLQSCSKVGITCGTDGIEGPFKLEIEYFGLEFQPYHKNICPYESYYLGKNIAE